MVVMEPALGVMEVAMLPALNRSFSEYRLCLDSDRHHAKASPHDA